MALSFLFEFFEKLFGALVSLAPASYALGMSLSVKDCLGSLLNFFSSSRRVLIYGFSVILFSLSVSAQTYAPVIVTEGVFVLDPQHHRLAEIASHEDWTIDHVSGKGYEVYGPKGFSKELKTADIPFLHLEDLQAQQILNADDYPSFVQVERRLRRIVNRCSQIMEMVSIGKSEEGRDLWVVKVSSDPSQDQLKPEVKYISSMHGDEITGREVLQEFLEDICNNYKKDALVTRLVDSLEIFIMPSMNPDGSERRTRGNARGVDLNRDFPDFTERDNQNSPAGRALETQAVMNFQASRQFALSANFHGGAEVVNYPWDTDGTRHPEHSTFVELSLFYAHLVSYMKNSTEFSNGITNGYDWYEVNGGMQDWSNFWHGDMQLTIEISELKWPPYLQVKNYWLENRAALYRYLNKALEGSGFIVEGESSNQRSGLVKIFRLAENQREEEVGAFPFFGNEFFKVLSPGAYRYEVLVRDGKLAPRDFVFDVKISSESQKSSELYKFLEL